MGYYTVTENKEEMVHVLRWNDVQGYIKKEPSTEQSTENALWCKGDVEHVLACKSMKYLWVDVSKNEKTSVAC